MSGGADWEKSSEVIARSNVAVEEQIQKIKLNTKLTEGEKEARVKNLIAAEAERQARPILESLALKNQ